MMNSMQDGASAFDLILGGNPALYAIIRLSSTVSVSATLLASAVGLPLGALLALVRFPGRAAMSYRSGCGIVVGCPVQPADDPARRLRARAAVAPSVHSRVVA